MDTYDQDFMQVCEHYANVLGDKKLPGKSRQQFIDWMYVSKDYSDSNYKVMFANPSLYFRLFRINKVINSGDEQHHMMCVSGKIGKGKTTFATQACALVDPTFNMSRVCYLPHQFFKAAQESKPGQAILIDEGGNFFKALNTMGKMSKNLGQYFQMMRAKRLFIVICYDEYEKMMREIRDKMDSLYMKTPKKDEPAPRRYRYWVGWNQKGTDAVKDFLNAKKLPLTAPPLMRYAGIRGVHSAEFPTLNDVSEEAFKENKLNNVKEFEKLFLGEALKNFGLEEDHYKNEDKNKQTQAEKEKSYTYVSPQQYANKYGMDIKTVYRRIHADKIIYHKIVGDKRDTFKIPIEANELGNNKLFTRDNDTNIPQS